MSVHHVWFPMGDTGVTLTISREQLEIVLDALREVEHVELPLSKPKWRRYIAEEFERIMRESLDENPGGSDA